MGNLKKKNGKNPEQIKDTPKILWKVWEQQAKGPTVLVLIKKECGTLCQDKFLLISLIEYSGISLS